MGCEGMKFRHELVCHKKCGYCFLTKSRLKMITCANCSQKFDRTKSVVGVEI